MVVCVAIMALVQEIYTTQHTSRDALLWHIPVGDTRFFPTDKDTHAVMYTTVPPRSFPWQGVGLFTDVLALGGAHAAIVRGKRTNNKHLMSVGNIFRGIGVLGLGALACSAVGNLPIEATQAIVVPSSTPEGTSTPSFVRVVPEANPSRTPRPTATEIPKNPMFEGEPVLPGDVSRHTITLENGEKLRFSQGMTQSDMDEVLRVELNADSHPYNPPESRWENPNVSGIWPFIPKTELQRLQIECDGRCVVDILPQNADVPLYHTETQFGTVEGDHVTRLNASLKLPVGEQVWVRVTPPIYEDANMRWFTFRIGPQEDSKITYHGKDTEDFYMSLDTGDSFGWNDSGYMYGVIKKPIGLPVYLHKIEGYEPYIQKEGEAQIMRFGFDDSLNLSKDRFGMTWDDKPVMHVVAPVLLSPDRIYHITGSCDDICTIDVLDEYGASMFSTIMEGNGPYKTDGIVVNKPTRGWVMIDMEDKLGGGAGFMVHLAPDPLPTPTPEPTAVPEEIVQ